MTKPRHLDGRSAGSEVSGSASLYAGDSSYAWGVNFNNGNSNDWHRDNNNGFVRPVRSVRPGEYQHAQVSFRDLYDAWREARAGKKPSKNQLTFDTRWLQRLLDLQDRLNAGTWTPLAPTCFIAKRPKAREIHAPDFADRVVHHWLVPQLERILEPTFIHDSFANRTGKGTHAAVSRLRDFVRQLHSGQGGGWYLQLDVRTFFNSIHRPTLWSILKPRLVAAGLPDVALRATHALLRHSPLHAGVINAASPAERAAVPAHKRLENAAPGCGLPIGNLSSQFFANAYLDRLDQFVKRTLRVKRYVRYVDDFVLVHESREQLLAWQAEIERFLSAELRLELKPERKLKPLTAGIDFLGYILYPTHTLPRRRVVHHARAALQGWARAHVRGAVAIATPAQYRRLGSIWGSYTGHLQHANSTRLRQAIEAECPWLPMGRRRFDHRLEGQKVAIPIRGGAA